MKKYFLIIVATTALISSCETSTKEIANMIDKNVAEAEMALSRHDSTMQFLMENNRFDSIPKLTEETFSFLNLKYKAIHSLEIPYSATDYKKSAELYIMSLKDIVKAQDLYSNYTDSTSQQEADLLDNENIEAVKNAKIVHLQLMEYKSKMEKDS